MKIKILSIILILSFSAIAQQDIVVGERIIFDSKILNEERPLSIYLPNGYDQSNLSYPVLYLLDGEAHFLHAAGISSYLSTIGNIPQLIVVAIPNTNRNRDFTPTKTETPNSGGGETFKSFLKDELIPFIDDNYRTESFRIISGHSLTGMYSLHLLLTEPDLFDAYIAASPYVLYDNGKIVETARENISDYDKSEFIYFNIGNEPDYFKTLDELNMIFKNKFTDRVHWKFEKYLSDDHGTIPPKTLQAGLSFIFDEWQFPDDFIQKANVELLKKHYQKINEIYGYEADIPEAQVNLLAYQVMFTGRTDEAIELFEFNVELYPESANVYDSLGEGLEAVNKLEEAKENYQKAIKLAEKNNHPFLPIYKEHLENVQNKIVMN